MAERIEKKPKVTAKFKQKMKSCLVVVVATMTCYKKLHRLNAAAATASVRRLETTVTLSQMPNLLHQTCQQIHTANQTADRHDRVARVTF